MTVSLYVAGAGGAQVVGTIVTINVADLPASATNPSNENGWVLFKFAAPVTLAAATAYVVDAITSNGSQVTLYRDSTTANWSKMLRTTTQQAPAAGDDFIVLGEHTANDAGTITGDLTSGSAVISNVSSFTNIAVGKTLGPTSIASFGANNTISSFNSGAGTITMSGPSASTGTGFAFTVGGNGNNFTVTMNETAATDYGSAPTQANSQIQWCGVCKRGTFKFADGSAANPRLRLSNSLVVCRDGVFNIGTVATPIPLNSTAILEFDCAADGDYGLNNRDGAIHTRQGVPRTAGKNVVKCKITADAPATTNLFIGQPVSSSAITAAAASTVLDPTGTSLGAHLNTANAFGTATDSVANSAHFLYKPTLSSVPGGTTQVFSVWLERGTGTNNRYVRMVLGDNATPNPTNGIYAEIDLLAGTIGTCTAIGNGTAVSSSITPFGTGYICTIIGSASSASATVRGGLASMNGPTGAAFTYAGDATQNFRYYNMQLYTASALPTPTLTVDTDTGWLAGDVLAIASTTRTNSECELVMLASNAGASTLTLMMAPIYVHHGSVPVPPDVPPQAEVINLTRNVKIRATNSTFPSYTYDKGLASVDVDWVEHYFIGDSTTVKYGLEIEGTASGQATAKSYQYCSIHDTEDGGMRVSGANSVNLVFSNNVGWYCATSSGPAWQIAQNISLSDWVMDNNTLIRAVSSTAWSLTDLGGVFTNNVVAGHGSTNGYALAEASMIGTFNGNSAHSGGSIGLAFNSGVNNSVIEGFSSWRNTGVGVSFSSACSDVTIKDLVAFGNATANISMSASSSARFVNPILNSDSAYGTNNGIIISTTGVFDLVVDGGDFGTASGTKIAHGSGDINISAVSDPHITLRNTKLNASTEVLSAVNLGKSGFVSSQKNDQTGGNHKTYLQNGIIQTDATIFKTAAPSMRMTPSSSPGLTFSANATVASANLTAVGTLSAGWLPKVGDRVTVSASAFPEGVTITAIDYFAGTATLSAPAILSGTRTITLLRKLESATQFGGTKVGVNSGSTKTPSVWVRKQQENLFTFSEDFSNSAWTISNATRTSGETDWQGGVSASKFLETAIVSNNHGVARNSSVTIVVGPTYTLSFVMKSIGRQWLRLIADSGNTSWIDIINGVVGTTSSAHTINIASLGSGWYRYTVTFVSSLSAFAPTFTGASADNSSGSYLGDVTKGFFLDDVQIEIGSVASPYQATTSSNQTGYNGVQPRLILKANSAIGVASDTVLDTMSIGSGAWEQLTGTTPAATDDGVFEFVVDCDGTTGWINVDDWTIA